MLNFVYKEDYSFDDLRYIMQILRSDDGCPWDKEQTHESIRENLLEEAYEAAEAIDNGDNSLLCEELGDLLLQVFFHSQMSSEQGGFTVDDAVSGVCKKLIIRHPHIFGDTEAKTSAEVLNNWDDIKRKTKGQKTHTQAMDAVAKSLPALVRAVKVAKKAEKAGICFTDFMSKADKLDRLAQNGNPSDISEALGELLFSIAGFAQSLNLNPERALELTTNNFITTFANMEEKALTGGLALEDLSASEMEILWNKAKSEVL